MDSMMRFNSNFSTPTTRISRGWSTRLSLSRTRPRRWRRMERGKCCSQNILQEATPGLTCRSHDISLEARTWFTHQCMDNVLHSKCSNRISMCSIQISRCRILNSKHLDPMCSNRLTRTCSKALAQPLQPHNMHQFKEAVMAELASSVV
jgi:hypothetical protein